MISGEDLRLGRDYVVACVVATECPPAATDDFTAEMVPLAIRGVCDVIRNRMRHPGFPNSAVEVVLEEHNGVQEFSGVGSGYWERAMAGKWEPAHVASCLTAWREVLISVADGATHYFSPISMVPPDRVPTWAAQMTEILVPKISPRWFRWFQ